MTDNSKFHAVPDELRNMAESEHLKGKGGGG